MKRTVLLAVVLAVTACGSPAYVPPPPAPERVFALGDVDERPEIVLTPPLHYPEGGRDGVVVVHLVIDTAGNPEPATARVVAGSDSAMARAARALVLRTLFRPARVRNRVVQVEVNVPVEFSIGATPPVTIVIEGDVYGVQDVEERPHIVSGPVLTYPAALLFSRIGGRVVIEAVVDTTGRVEDETVRVIVSTDPRFNQSAKDYVQAARFTPGRVGGRAVRVRVQLPVEFKPPTRN